MYFGIGSRHQLSGWIRHIDFSKQSVRRGVDCMAAKNHTAFKLFSRKRCQFEGCLPTIGNLIAVSLGHRNKYPDCIDLRDSEEFKCHPSVPRIYEVSDIGPALRDDSIKWSN